MNKLLTILVLVVLTCMATLFAAAQVRYVRVEVPYHRSQHGYFARMGLYEGYFLADLFPASVVVQWWPANGTGGHSMPQQKVTIHRQLIPAGRFYAPQWRVDRDPGQPVSMYTAIVPFWLMMLPPGMLLAWRLWRTRKKDTRGFEVAAS